jgi:hypothetical protein
MDENGKVIGFTQVKNMFHRYGFGIVFTNQAVRV